MIALIVSIFFSLFGQDIPTTRPNDFDPGARDGETTEIIIDDEYGV